MKETEQAKSFPLVPCALAYLVPGCGHLYLGKRYRGLIFLVAIPLMFLLGLYMGGKLYEPDAVHPLTYLAVFANLGNGLLYFASKLLGIGAGRILDVTFEHGCTFILVSGLLNFLVVLDVYDIAIGKKS